MLLNKTNKTINLVTLGCSKNLIDSERLLKQLLANNFEIKHNANTPSDIAIINTCGFINEAKQESINTILSFIEAKKKNTVAKVIVMGCLSERYKNELANEIKEVDGFYGFTEISQLIHDLGGGYKMEYLNERILTTPSHYAYLKISEGCNRQCSFCAIPLIRGKHISKTVDELVIEAENFLKVGVKELILVAQDLTYYGIDLYKESKLVELLDQLTRLQGLEWLRLHYAYPIHFSDSLIRLINERANICKYVDIPIQHVSDKLLKSMKRGVSAHEQKALLVKLRKMIPDVAIRSTLIVGYPGETETDFKALKDFVIEMRFDRLGVFMYSAEEGTDAYKLKDNVSEKVKIKRMEELMDIQQHISLELNEKKIGKIFKVLIDRKENDYFVGRTQFDSPEVDNEVLIPISSDVIPGRFYGLKIASASAFDLYAELPISKL